MGCTVWHFQSDVNSIATHIRVGNVVFVALVTLVDPLDVRTTDVRKRVE